jgi:hypothetical protein
MTKHLTEESSEYLHCDVWYKISLHPALPARQTLPAISNEEQKINIQKNFKLITYTYHSIKKAEQ